jgi:hypothetical protein
MAVHRPKTTHERDGLVTDRSSKTTLVQSISSHTVVRRYPLVASLPSFPELFTSRQLEQLKSPADERFSVITERERDERSTRADLGSIPTTTRS